MFIVSTDFLDALGAPSVVSTVRITTTSGVMLAASDGSVTMDSRRGITRACDLTLIPTADLSAQEVYELVMQPTTEIKVQRGIIVNGTPEYVPLGVFSTDSASIDKARTGPVKWTGSDRSKIISRARFTDPYQIAAGTSLATAGAALLADRWPSVTVDFDGISTTLGAALVFEQGSDSDPWDHARTLFADHGYDLHFDGSGTARATTIPDPAITDPVFTFGVGDTNLILGLELKGTLEQTYNGVIATGEGTDIEAPVRAIVWDEDPTSPTYIGTGLRIPYFYSSPLLTTVEACEQAARTMLARVKGRTEQLSWPAVVNPALEPLDVVTIAAAGSQSTCIIDSLTIPLRASEPMSAIARETRRSF